MTAEETSSLEFMNLMVDDDDVDFVSVYHKGTHTSLAVAAKIEIYHFTSDLIHGWSKRRAHGCERSLLGSDTAGRRNHAT